MFLGQEFPIITIGLGWSRYTHDVAMMDAQADRLLLTFHDGFAGGLIGTDGDQRHLPGWGFGITFIDERKVDFFDDLQDRLGLKGRPVQPLLDLGEKFGIEGLRDGRIRGEGVLASICSASYAPLAKILKALVNHL